MPSNKDLDPERDRREAVSREPVSSEDPVGPHRRKVKRPEEEKPEKTRSRERKKRNVDPRGSF